MQEMIHWFVNSEELEVNKRIKDRVLPMYILSSYPSIQWEENNQLRNISAKNVRGDTNNKIIGTSITIKNSMIINAMAQVGVGV